MTTYAIYNSENNILFWSVLQNGWVDYDNATLFTAVQRDQYTKLPCHGQWVAMLLPGITPHWHEQNPWKDNIFYVELEELADCSIMIGHTVQVANGDIVIWTAEDMLRNFKQHGTKLDAYVLTGSLVTAGIRFGPEPEEYISPGFSLAKLHKLIRKEQQSRRKYA